MLNREFWKVFEVTGSIEAYLYYKDSLEIKSAYNEYDELGEKKIIQGV